MKRKMLRALTIVVTLFALLTAGVGSMLAHDATPATQPITDTVLGKGMPSDAPGKVLQLERITIAPGATIPTHIHPGAYVIFVESGEFGFTVVKGTAEITRQGSTTTEAIEPGAEVIGHPGDAIFENGGTVHSARNAGSTPTVVLTAALLLADQPSLQPANDEGTPVS